MPKVTLTDAFITGESCVCPECKAQEDYRDQHSRGRGLVLRVSKAGSKRWTFIYSLGGKERRITLGEYGRDADRLTLSQARAKAATLRASVLNGEDPAATIAEAKSVRKAQQGETVQALLDLHITRLERKGRRESYLKDIRQRFAKHVLPNIGKRSISLVTSHDIAAILRPLEEAMLVATHNKVLTLLPPLWKLAKLPSIMDDFEKMPEPESPEPYSLEEVARIWRALDDPKAKVHPITREAIRFAALTMKRAGECAGAMVSELDMKNKIWTIPAAKMKGNKPESVPLSPQAVKVVERALKSPLRPEEKGEPVSLFVSPRSADNPLGRNSLSRAFVRARRIAGIPDDGRSLHVLRHSGATALAASGIAPHIVQSLLGHKGAAGGSRVSRRYNQYEFLNERRACLDTLGRWIEEAVTGEELPDKVVNLR